MDLQIRSIFRFIGLPCRYLPFNRSKQQKQTILGAIGGASWGPWAPTFFPESSSGRASGRLALAQKNAGPHGPPHGPAGLIFGFPGRCAWAPGHMQGALGLELVAPLGQDPEKNLNSPIEKQP